MSERKLYVCTQCHGFWSALGGAPACPKCGGKVHQVDVDYDTYASWTAEEKADFKQSYINTHNFTDGPTSVFAKAADTDFWIRGVDLALNIAMVMFCIAAVVLLIVITAAGGVEGFFIDLLAAASLAVVGFLLVAGMKIFLGMAKDLKAIRSKMEQ